MTQYTLHVLESYVLWIAESGANWLLQSTVLIVAGLLIAQLLRRSVILQSIVYRTTLVAILACPLVAVGMHQAGLRPVFAIQWPGMQAVETVDNAMPRSVDAEPFHVSATVPNTLSRPIESPPTESEPSYDSHAAARPVSPAEVSSAEVLAKPRPSGEASAAAAPTVAAVAAKLSVVVAVFLVTGVLAALWLAVTTFLVARLLFSFRKARQLCIDSDLAGPESEALCRSVAEQVCVRVPPVRSTPFLHSPCLIGLRKPAILLPEEEAKSPQREVFVHELAHLRRNDCFWTMLSRIATSVLWFQPLAWCLSRRLAATSEEVCDDYVVRFGGDLKDYAQRLISVAENTLPQPAIAGVGMVAYRSSLGRRVKRILDSTRSVSIEVGRRFVALTAVTTLLLTVGVTLFQIGRSTAAPPSDVNTDATAAAVDDNNSDDADVIQVNGRVVDDEGEPVAGAEILVANGHGEVDERTRTDEHGRFKASFDKSKFTQPDWNPNAWHFGYVIASVPGYGPSWVSGKELAIDANPTLKLVRDDVKVQGRVLDLEGQPVPKATVRIWDLHASEDDRLTALLKKLRVSSFRADDHMREMRYFPGGCLELIVSQGTLKPGDNDYPEITTDEQGRFEFSGFGRERMARIWIEGRGIRSGQIKLLTIPKIEEKWQPANTDQHTRAEMQSGRSIPQIFAAQLDYVAQPSKPVKGIVRDRETEQPLEGISVGAYTRPLGSSARTVTDENGRFELTGLGTEGQLEFNVGGPDGPDDGSKFPYIAVERQIHIAAGKELKDETTFELVRGVVVRGKLTDSETGKPVKARITYVSYGDNPHLAELKDGVTAYLSATTGDHGDFQLAVPPGPGTLTIYTRLSGGPTKYRPATAEDFGRPVDEQGFVATVNHGLLRPEHYEGARAINFQPGEQPDELSLTVQPITDVLQVRCVDSKGKQVHVRVAGRLPRQDNYTAYGFATKTIELIGIEEKPRRPIVFSDKRTNLAAILYANKVVGKQCISDLKRDKEGVALVKLSPSATISGRLFDAEGRPVPATEVMFMLVPDAKDPRNTVIQFDRVLSEPDGTFRLECIPAGGPYWLGVRQGVLAQIGTVAEGQEVALGDLNVAKATPPQEFRPRQAARSVTKPTQVERKTSAPKTELTGTVLDPQGKPVANTQVVVVGNSVTAPTGVAQRRFSILARAKTNDTGRFAFDCALPSFAEGAGTRNYVNVAAMHPRFGIAWQPIKSNANQEIDLKLTVDKPLEGRVLDLEGKPVAGASVSLVSISAANPKADLDAWEKEAANNPAEVEEEATLVREPITIKPRRIARFPSINWFVVDGVDLVHPVRTDAMGRFTLRGLGENREVTLKVTGDRIASSQLIAVTRDMKPVPMPIGDPRFPNQIAYGAKFSFTAEPSRTIRGVVNDIDSKAPLSGATVQISVMAGSSLSVEGFVKATSDRQGRFEIRGLPARNGHRLEVIPTGLPYLATDLNVPATDGLDAVEMKVELKRGVWIEGKVTDKNTGEPVNASVAYFPFVTNKAAEGHASFHAGRFHHDLDGRFRTKPDGSFRVAGLPGRGLVMALADQSQYYLNGQGQDSIEDLYLGEGERRRLAVYHMFRPDAASAMAEVNAEGDGAVCHLELVPIDRHRIDVTDAAGHALAGIRVRGQVSRIRGGHNPYFRVAPIQNVDNFEVLGLEDKQSRLVLVEHPSSNQGIVAKVSNDDVPTELKLQPFASIRGRLVDENGKPLKTARIHPVIGKTVRFMGLTPKGAMVESRGGENTLDLATLEDDGSFQCKSLLPGTDYTLLVQTDDDKYYEIKVPGVTPRAEIDLGVLRRDGDEFKAS